ncbi:MAG: hypothetical protein K8I02_05435, partial [Candidatus Methylomirabilis sp.]|nr:hypothetical protein [Deltaproteobacteria bacterium]
GGGGIGVSRQDILVHPDDLTLVRAEIARNYSGLNGGGGIAIDSGNATIRDSYIHDNIAGGAGGGLNLFNATKLPVVLIEGSLIAGNISGANEDGSSPAIPTGSGGGVRNTHGVLTVLNSTITGNDARGVLIEVGPGIPPIRSSGFGGGLADSGATGTEPIGMIVNSTIAYNVGVSASQLWDFSSAAGSPLGLANTIVAGTGLADAAPNCGKNGPKDGFKSLGGNLSSDASPCRFLEPTDMTGVAALGLDMTLADNGGETDTLALMEGSPAIGFGVEDHCPETDQRGVARKAKCDAGAFERVHALDALRMSLEEAVQIPDSDLGGFVTQIRALAGLP